MAAFTGGNTGHAPSPPLRFSARDPLQLRLFLSIWDKMFHTYIAQPEMGHERMKIGLPLFRQAREQWLDKMLTQPFRER